MAVWTMPIDKIFYDAFQSHTSNFVSQFFDKIRIERCKFAFLRRKLRTARYKLPFLFHGRKKNGEKIQIWDVNQNLKRGKIVRYALRIAKLQVRIEREKISVTFIYFFLLWKQACITYI